MSNTFDGETLFIDIDGQMRFDSWTRLLAGPQRGSGWRSGFQHTEVVVPYVGLCDGCGADEVLVVDCWECGMWECERCWLTLLCPEAPGLDYWVDSRLMAQR